MRHTPTDEQREKDDKARELMEAARFVSYAERAEIDRRHKGYKQRAKNLAGIKGAYLPALAYERLILAGRLDEISAALDQDRKQLHEGWIDE